MLEITARFAFPSHRTFLRRLDRTAPIQRHQREQMASLENRSVSNLIEVMADERWKRLTEQQGVAYAKTVAEAMKLKLDMDNPADREKLRRAVLDLVAGRKMPKQKRRG